MITLDQTIDVLENKLQRPNPEIAIQISEDIKDSAIKKINKSHNKFLPGIIEMHKKALPLLENTLNWLLKETSKDETKYYVFARDGELAYDAIHTILKKEHKNISDKLVLIQVSSEMQNPSPEYFHQLGINNQNLKNGLKPIFIDSGHYGSLFDKTITWSKINPELAKKQIKGYLFFNAKNSKHLQIQLSKNVSFHQKSDLSPFEYHGHLPLEVPKNILTERIGWYLCRFMELMPKATPPYATTFKNNVRSWQVKPDQNSEYILNPFMALTLQKATIDYFSNTKIK